jgi:hypothetical protein
MAELRLWTNSFDLVVAESAEEALSILHASEFYDPGAQDPEDEQFESYPHATINWWEECGYGEPQKLTIEQLIDKNGKGYVGITEC